VPPQVCGVRQVGDFQHSTTCSPYEISVLISL